VHKKWNENSIVGKRCTKEFFRAHTTVISGTEREKKDISCETK
jgi:hypothetical protein